MRLEHRIVGEVRAVSEPQGIFDALAVTYGTVDDYASVWAPGCFTESLNTRMPVVGWAHDWAQPIGRGTGWRDTAEGPIVACRLDNHPDVPLAKQAIAQLASGTLTDVSVGFSAVARREPTDEERKQWPGCREVIEKADMDELSIVLRGAVPGAQVLAFRGSRPTTRRIVWSDPKRTRRVAPSAPVSGRPPPAHVQAKLDSQDAAHVDEVMRRWGFDR